MIRNQTGRPVGATGNRAVLLAWEKFLSGDGMPRDAVRRMVEDSWRRCLDQGVDPIQRSAPLAFDGDALHGLKQRHQDLIQAARPIMAQAREFLSESRTLMALTDPEGVILWVEGDPNAKYKSQDIQLVPGAVWDEAVSGTNAIGTALASGQPVQICAAEHFCEGIKHWTCSASVIRDPYDQQILGALDISGLSGSHNNHCLALAVAGAGRIETRLAALDMERRGRLLDVTLTQDKRWAERGVMIFDHRGRMVRANESAEFYLNSLGLDLGACNALDLLGLTGDSLEAVPLPQWMNRDWLEPVIERDERLGTLLAFPDSQKRKPGKQEGAAAFSDPGEEDPFSAIVGTSATLSIVKKKARQLARLPIPVLILGPTGAGKEVFARAFHNAGPNAKGPFVPINCGGMTRDLLASELFGYVDGAFTGARRGGMAGKFEAADGGTLFLDEIGEMPLDLQAHFLRVLEEGEVYRLGENKPRKVKVRVVAATNRDLRAAVAEGNFRMDLFYRLAVTVLRLPALADHKEDIPLLVRHFIDLTRRAYGIEDKIPTADMLKALTSYSWPGNVRELRNVIEGMALLADDRTLTWEDLPMEITAMDGGYDIRPASGAEKPSLVRAHDSVRLTEAERENIIIAIGLESGNLTRAAMRLGIAKSTLYEKMKRHGIDRSSAFRGQGPR